MERRIGMVEAYAYGFPRIGRGRSYKFLIEGYWEGKISEKGLREGLLELEERRIGAYASEVDAFPLGELTFYDKMLDTALMVGLYSVEDLQGYYRLCRGREALTLTKWFNTNYHYLVPEVRRGSFRLNSFWVDGGLSLSHSRGVPYLLGPFTFLKLSRLEGVGFGDALFGLAQVYGELLEGMDEVHMDEPALVMELTDEERTFLREVYRELGRKSRIHLFAYYAGVDRPSFLYDLPLSSLGLDLVHGRESLKSIMREGFSRGMRLVAGVVDGRSPWRTDLEAALRLLEKLARKVDRLAISNAAPLYHLPLSLEGEDLAPQLSGRLAFAREKLREIGLLAKVFRGEERLEEVFEPGPPGLVNFDVKRRVEEVKGREIRRLPSYGERRVLQKGLLGLPLFPTTTIGSFPQTSEVRQKRLAYKRGELAEGEYKAFVKEKIREAIRFQEEVGLDVLVHGEFERSDMVEFFAERLDGIATTAQGWVISYGTRCYRPPIIHGDVIRRRPLTLDEILYAQSLTDKPVKGMLTGPVTILAWSFVREDLPEEEVAYQIALALREEVMDYEAHGIKVIQVDEPALREKAPIKRREWDAYFSWAVKAFNLVVSRVRPDTQIHIHMCYSRFEDILGYLEEMDFDVISIEASRSRGEILRAFEERGFDREIGLGVWDVHSKEVPGVEEMMEIVERALKVIDEESFWINPDCGLKTRGWEEVGPALKNMVELATVLRRRYASGEA